MSIPASVDGTPDSAFGGLLRCRVPPLFPPSPSHACCAFEGLLPFDPQRSLETTAVAVTLPFPGGLEFTVRV